MISYWRGIARPIICKIIADNEGKSEKEIRKLISKAYPFGERQHHPYKVWRDEVKKQLAKKFPKEKPVEGTLFEGEA